MEDKILADFAKAWQTLDAELIIKYLDDSFVYDSQWFFESLDCEAYKKYLRTKFLTMKEKNAGPLVEIVDDPQGGKMLDLDQKGNTACYRIEVKNGKVVKADMCMF
jgi:hypothetical protein